MVLPAYQPRSHALRGIVSLGGSQVVKIVTQFASVIMLSRMLAPEDFGLAASVAPLVALMAVFQDFGLQQAVIQRASISREELTRVFWVAVLLGAIPTVALVALSPLAAWFFHDARLVWVTMAAGTPLLAFAAGSIPSALLARQGRFGVLALNDSMTACVALGTALAAAALGMAYWSLIISTITSSAIGAIFVGVQARWVPGRPVWAWPNREVLKFGKNLTGFTVMNFLARNMDNVLIGHAWGGTELGYYDRAYKLFQLPIENIASPVYRVIVPMLSRIETDKERFRMLYLRTASQVVLLTVPGMAAMVATAPNVVILMFGDRWSAVTPIFFWLGVVGLIQPLGNTLSWIFISQAKTQSLFRLSAMQTGTTVLSFLAGLHWGSAGVAVAYAISEYAIRLPVGYWWVGRAGPVSAQDLVSIQAPALAAAGMTWLVSHNLLADLAGLTGFGLIAATGIVSYLLSLLAASSLPSGRAAVQETASFILRSIPRPHSKKVSIPRA